MILKIKLMTCFVNSIHTLAPLMKLHRFFIKIIVEPIMLKHVWGMITQMNPGCTAFIIPFPIAILVRSFRAMPMVGFFLSQYVTLLHVQSPLPQRDLPAYNYHEAPESSDIARCGAIASFGFSERCL